MCKVCDLEEVKVGLAMTTGRRKKKEKMAVNEYEWVEKSSIKAKEMEPCYSLVIQDENGGAELKRKKPVQGERKRRSDASTYNPAGYVCGAGSLPIRFPGPLSYHRSIFDKDHIKTLMEGCSELGTKKKLFLHRTHSLGSKNQPARL